MLMDNEVEVTVCDICGDAGRKRENLLAICCKCPNGAEHTYCMSVMRKTLPKGDWMCEECTMRSECQESGCPVNLNSLERKTEGTSISSTSHLSAERIGVPLEARPDKKERVIITSGKVTGCYKRRAGKLAVEIDRKRRIVCSVRQSDVFMQRLMDPSLKKLGKEKVEASLPVCSVRQSDEYSKFEAAILSKNSIIPRPDYIWLGKFQIHISDGIELIYDGIQAHLSTHALQKASEVMDKLPNVIMLEELPRLRMWPAHFMESGPTEKDIALYFYAKDVESYGAYYKGLIECMTKKDLAFKGNINGFELLIFPSNVLPEESQRWNQFPFLWGVFRECKINNSSNTSLSNSQEQENRDIVRIQDFDLNVNPKDEGEEEMIIRDFDLNAYPEDEDENDMAGVHETGALDSINIGSSRDRIYPGGASYSSGCSESAIGKVSGKSNIDMKGKTPKQENYDAEDVVELLQLRAAETVSSLHGIDKDLAYK